MSRRDAGADGKTGNVELRLLDEEFGLVHLFGLDDLPSGGGYAEGVFLGGERGGGNDAPRQCQRIRRLPREWLCKAGGKNERGAPEPHDK